MVELKEAIQGLFGVLKLTGWLEGKSRMVLDFWFKDPEGEVYESLQRLRSQEKLV